MPVDAIDLDEIFKHAEGDLRALRGSKIFITGGTGYVGRWLLETLQAAADLLQLEMQIVVLTRDPVRFQTGNPHICMSPFLRTVKGDIRDFPYPEEDFSHVIHAATDVVQENSPLETFDVATTGTKRILEFCRAKSVRDVLMLSSGAVYGRTPMDVERMPEDGVCALSPSSVKSAYGLGKLAAEWLGTAYSEDGSIRYKSARLFAQVGPYLALDRQFAAGNFILNALKREAFLIKGDGTAVRSYMYATDLVKWLLAILVRGESGRAYNVGSEQAISVYELARLVASTAQIDDPKIEIRGAIAPGAAPQRYIPDITRAKTQLGLDIKVGLEEALRRTIDWYRRSADY